MQPLLSDAELLQWPLYTAALTTRDREILRLRWGLLGHAYEYEDIARLLMLPTEEIHELEQRALRHLRYSPDALALRPYLDALQEQRG